MKDRLHRLRKMNVSNSFIEKYTGKPITVYEQDRYHHDLLKVIRRVNQLRKEAKSV